MTTDLKSLDNNALITHLRNLVLEHKKYEIEILLSIGEIIARRLDLKAGFCNIAEYCEEVFGLSQEMAWKKARAAKIIGPYPKLLEMLREGKTHVSHIALVANRISQANQEEIYKFLPGKSRRDLQFFLERLQMDGTYKEVELTIEIKFRVTKEVLEKLDHVRGLLAKNGTSYGDNAKVLEAALDTVIEKKDPIKKAERAEKRLIAQQEILHFVQDDERPKPTGTGDIKKRPAIPMAIRHKIFLKNNGQCSFRAEDGRRCGERAVLHVDHLRPVAFGGSHDLHNLQILCRSHNNFMAEQMMGKEFIAENIQLRSVTSQYQGCFLK